MTLPAADPRLRALMQVLVCDNISPKGVDCLEAQAELEVTVVKDGLTDELLANAEAVIVRSATKITPEVMDKAPKLRVVGRAGVGWTTWMWIMQPTGASWL